MTGCMIFILGISLVPTTCKNFFSYATYQSTGVFDGAALAIAAVSFLAMLACSIFWKKPKLYAVLIGIALGYVLSLVTGVLDVSSFSSLSDVPLFALPLPSHFELSFDWVVALPFIVITAAGLIDNIGDFSAAQAANNGPRSKPNWQSIQKGIRACGVGLMLSGLLGGSISSTSTSNTGIAKATGITSRVVVYITGGILVVLAFCPRVISVLSIIPEPVLGAVLMFATCYIMASGFGMIMTCELDDRRIFLMFVSIVLAASTLIPGIYDFLPSDISSVIVSPIVFGALALVFMKCIVSLGNKKHFKFSYHAATDDIIELNEHIDEVCRNRAVAKDVASKLRVGVDALCESFIEDNPDAVVDFNVAYESTRIKVNVTADHIADIAKLKSTDDEGQSTFSITLLMLSNMFDRVESKVEEGRSKVLIEADLD